MGDSGKILIVIKPTHINTQIHTHGNIRKDVVFDNDLVSTHWKKVSIFLMWTFIRDSNVLSSLTE